MRRRADERRHEAVEHPRDAAEDERGEPAEEHGGRHEHAPERQPEEVGDDEREPEEDEEARAAEIVAEVDRDRMRWQLGLVGQPVGGGVGVPGRDHQRVRGDLRPVAAAVRRRVAHPARHPPTGEAGEPGEHGDRRRQAAEDRQRGEAEPEPEHRRPAERPRDERGGHDEDEPEERAEPPLGVGRVDLDVDGVGGCGRRSAGYGDAAKERYAARCVV